MTLFSVATSNVRSMSRSDGRSLGEKRYENAVRSEVEAVVLSWTRVLLRARSSSSQHLGRTDTRSWEERRATHPFVTFLASNRTPTLTSAYA